MFGNKGKQPASSSSSRRSPQSNAPPTGPGYRPNAGQNIRLPSIVGQPTLQNIPGQPARSQGGNAGAMQRPTLNPAPRFHRNDPTSHGRLYPPRPLPTGPALIDSLPGRGTAQQPPSSPRPASRQPSTPIQSGGGRQSASQAHERRSMAPSPPQRQAQFTGASGVPPARPSRTQIPAANAAAGPSGGKKRGPGR
jgi:hypothetical protein